MFRVLLQRRLLSQYRSTKAIQDAKKMVKLGKTQFSMFFKKSSAVFLTSPNYVSLAQGDKTSSSLVEDWTLMIHDQAPVQDLVKLLRAKLKVVKDTPDIQAMITSLSRLDNHREEEIQSLAKILDEFCIQKVSSIELHQGLQLCYSWYETGATLKKIDNKNWANWVIQYPRVFVNSHIWSNMSSGSLDVLDPGEFLFVMLLTALYKDKSMLVKLSNLEGYGLPKVLEDKCLEAMAFWSPIEIGIIAEILYMMNVILSVHNQTLADKFMQEFKAAPPLGKGYEFLSPVSALSKLISKLGSSTSSSLVTSDSEPMLDKMNFQEKIRVLKMISANPSKDLNTFMSKFVSSIRGKDLQNVKRLKDLEMLASSLFTLNCDRKDLLQDILEATKKVPKHDPRSGRSLMYLLKFLAGCGVINDNLMSKVMRSANANAELAQAQDPDQVCQAGINFLFNFFQKIDPKYQALISRISVQDRYNINAVRAIAELDFILELEHPEYKGIRLDKGLRSKLIKMTCDAQTNDSRLFVHRQLNEILDNKTYFGPVLPHFPMMSSIVFCVHDLDKTSSQEVPKDLLVREDLPKLPLIKDHKWYCLVMPSAQQTWPTENEIAHAGSLRQQTRHLSLLGFVPLVLYRDLIKDWQEKGELTMSNYLRLFKFHCKES